MSSKQPTLDATFWNDIYLDDDTGWDLGQPSPAITAYFSQVEWPEADILIPGCGNAWEGEHLNRAGFKNITLLDFAAESRKNFLRRVPTFDPDRFLSDAFFEHEGRYDYIVEHTFFCALHPSDRARYADKVHRLLKPGGKLVGVLFDVPKNAYKPPYGGSADEYRGYFAPLFAKVHLESCHNSIAKRQGEEVFVLLEK